MNEHDYIDRLLGARVAHLATADADGRPHMVPIVFALLNGQIVTAVDHKPKRTARLKRLENIRANPAVSVLADHYDDDWTSLWWVRVDGPARIAHEGSEFNEAIAALAAKYAQYQDRPPTGPAIAIDIEKITGWSSRG